MSRFLEFEGIDSLSESFFEGRPLHLAIGIFDGLHRGHQAVIRSAVEAAEADKGLTGLLTFWPHPSRLFKPETPIRMLMPLQQKSKRLQMLGVHFVIQQKFDKPFASVEAERFVPLLKKALPTLKVIYVGANFYFGKGRKGDVSKLKEEGQRNGVTVISIPRVNYEKEPISSTRIRSALSDGAIEKVNALLGYFYFIEGVVQPGQSMGQKIGFPTLNLPWEPEAYPCYGVYVVKVEDAFNKKRSYRGVANYGLKPTMVETQKSPLLEVHLLEDSPFKVGDTIKVEWLSFVRPEQKFSSIEALKHQISKDKKTAEAWWEQHSAAESQGRQLINE